MGEKGVDYVREIIGNRGVVKLRKVVDDDGGDIQVKLEYEKGGG